MSAEIIPLQSAQAKAWDEFQAAHQLLHERPENMTFANAQSVGVAFRRFLDTYLTADQQRGLDGKPL